MITWEYLAGFLDGDGWITFSMNKNCSTRRYAIGFTQANREKRSMKRILNFLIQNGINAKMKPRVVEGSIKKKTKMLNIIVREQVSMVRLLEKVAQHLLFKRKKALEGLKYLKDRIDKRGVGLEVHVQKTKRYWKIEEDKNLLILHRRRYSSRAIAFRLSRSIDSVSHRLYRLGVTR